MAAQVAVELKTGTYATPPMEERRKKENIDIPLSTREMCNSLENRMKTDLIVSKTSYLKGPHTPCLSNLHTSSQWS